MTFLERLVKADIWIMGKLNGKPNETLSSAAWNAHLTNGWFGWTHWIIDALFYIWESEHCRKDWEYRKEVYQ